MEKVIQRKPIQLMQGGHFHKRKHPPIIQPMRGSAVLLHHRECWVLPQRNHHPIINPWGSTKERVGHLKVGVHKQGVFTKESTTPLMGNMGRGSPHRPKREEGRLAGKWKGMGDTEGLEQ